MTQGYLDSSKKGGSGMRIERLGFVGLGLVILGLGILGIVKSNRAQANPRPMKIGGIPIRQELPVPPGQVTRTEASAAFKTLDAAVTRVVLGTQAKPAEREGGGAVISRGEIVREMHRLFEICRPQFKVTPRPTPVESAVITIPPGQDRHKLETLIAFGCVAKSGPLAASKTEGLSVREFGDA
jgi:hypothetical protein